MSQLSRRTKLIIFFVVAVVAGYGIVLFFQFQSRVPEAFVNARSQGAIIAQNIVTTSNQSTATLEQVNKDDLAGNYKDALTLVS